MGARNRVNAIRRCTFLRTASLRGRLLNHAPASVESINKVTEMSVGIVSTARGMKTLNLGMSVFGNVHIFVDA